MRAPDDRHAGLTEKLKMVAWPGRRSPVTEILDVGPPGLAGALELGRDGFEPTGFERASGVGALKIMASLATEYFNVGISKQRNFHIV